MNETIKIPIIKVLQNKWRMYIGVINAKDLYEISEVDRIRLVDLKIPKYAGYQRAIVDGRLNAIKEYLSTSESTFPGSIIITIDSEKITNWKSINEIISGENPELEGMLLLEIEKEKGAVKIIDGQHRTAALVSANSEFQVIITIFVDLEMSNCAQIFATINSTQKAVNPSIAYQLFGYSEYRSPQKTAHNIAETLNKTEGAPFYKKLRMLGTKDDWTNGVLSQATFCKHLMNLYTKDPKRDEICYLNNDKLDSYEGYPLRDLFVNKNDKKILEIVWKYFYNVASTWHEQWHDNLGNSVLIKTTGYNAFMDVLKKWLQGERRNEIINDNGVKEALLKIKTKYEQDDYKFIRINYPAGHQGVKTLRDRLLVDLEIG